MIRSTVAIFGHVHMPALEGGSAWLNSEPLGPDELRGHVVVVNFWTLTCINWLRTEPYVRAWSNAYREDGLIVVGVHTPEFRFEQELERVRLATTVRGIDYPVVLDPDFAIWNAFDNHYWPALYFVDREGVIRDHHVGEGRYDHSERTIQKLLGIERDLVSDSTVGVGVEAEADWHHLRSPETYLGYARGERRADEAAQLSPNNWALTGDWVTGPEDVVLEQAGGGIAFRFHARDAHLVMSPGTNDPIPFRVLLDGEPPGESHGVDVDADGNGLLDAGRMYQLIRQPGGIEDRTVEISFGAAGAEAYVFTFG